ncbi:MAG: sugar phosphate isomerase/epimerase [Spirochaetales bacterium]|nr:sugar phosphate isomerase/epimerase [Spirochaetales bacterium]
MKYAIILGNLGNTCDRFLSSGYKDQPSKQKMLEQAAAIEAVEGVELVGNWDITAQNVQEMGELLAKHALKCVSIIPDHFAEKRWGYGALAARDPGVRRQAVEETARMAEAARTLGCPLINLWPGQDGYDYPLQADFRQERLWIEEGIGSLCREYPDIRFSLEYKPKEPRTHSYLARAADTLLVAQRIGTENVGVTIDTGHSFVAGENVAEAAVLLQMNGNKLFHMHFNDNYRSWDDDMIVGSVHLVEYLELLFWLRETGYQGWYSMDQYPYREDAQGALRESVEFLKALERLLDERSMGEIRELLKRGDAVKSSEWIRKRVFG